MKKIAWLVFISCCIFFSFQPVKYIMADGPIGLLNSKPVDSYMYLFTFYTHISLGGIALLIGWVQFVKKIRETYPKFHRVIGKIYVSVILIGGPCAFYLSFFVYGGWFNQMSFIIGSIVWIVSTYLGFSTIRKGNVAKHKEYMMYSYAGTCAAIVLRLVLAPLMMITSFKVAYGISIWLSWIPSVFFVYMCIHHKEWMILLYKKLYIKHISISLVVVAGVFFLLSFTRVHTWWYKDAIYQGETIEKVSNLSGSSFTADKLLEIENYLKEESETTSMMVLEKGKVIFEYGDVSEISFISSVRKSVLGMLLGKYVENGTIDLNKKIGDLGIHENGRLTEIQKQVTVKDVLASKSGVILADQTKANHTQQKDSITKGSFVYSDWDANVMAWILEQNSRKTVYQELQEQLAIPLGFEDWNIENQKSVKGAYESRYPVHHMYLSTRDMAKIGQLMLQNGRWNGKQLISKAWLQKMISMTTPKDAVNAWYGIDFSCPMQRSYGHMWWLFERFYDNPDFEGAYTATGNYGHFITVIPKREVVIVHKTTRDLLTLVGLSDRASTPTWRYWWILRNLMLSRKPIEALEKTKTTDEIIAFITAEYSKNSEYAISERLINEYAQNLANKGNHKDAIKFYELNLKIYPDHGYYTHRILNYYGTSLMALGSKKAALKAFKRSLELNPDNPEAKKNIDVLSQ